MRYTRGAILDESIVIVFFFQAEDGIRDYKVTGVQTCALPIFIMKDEPDNGLSLSAQTKMIRLFSALALGRSPDPLWGEMSLKTQQILDACLRDRKSVV